MRTSTSNIFSAFWVEKFEKNYTERRSLGPEKSFFSESIIFIKIEVGLVYRYVYNIWYVYLGMSKVSKLTRARRSEAR